MTASARKLTAAPLAARPRRSARGSLVVLPGGKDRASRPPRKKPDGTYLSMYFRDLAALGVLPPEAEFEVARQIEALELAVWEALLALPAALPDLLGGLSDYPAAAAEMRALGRPTRDRAGAVRRAAIKLRALDEDRLLSEAVLLTVERLALGVGVRGGQAPAVTREPGFATWRDQIARADRAASAARNAFVKANLRLVVSIARRFNHGRMALADLIQEGNLGLIKAVERYDYKKGFRFSTYASWWIRHAISRALADKGREIRLPVHMIDAQHRLAKARRALTAEHGRDPTVEELATATQMPTDKVEKMRTWGLEVSVPLDRPVGDGEGRVLAEVLEDPDRTPEAPAQAMAEEALLLEVKHLLGELRPIEADILRQRFGLTTEQELTLKEIGDKYNLSRERIRQLQEQALAKMRRALARRDLL